MDKNCTKARMCDDYISTVSLTERALSRRWSGDERSALKTTLGSNVT